MRTIEEIMDADPNLSPEQAAKIHMDENPPTQTPVEPSVPVGVTRTPKEIIQSRAGIPSSVEMKTDYQKSPEVEGMQTSKINASEQDYATRLKAARAKTNDIFDRRQENEQAIGTQMEDTEDAIRSTRQGSKTEAGIAAGGKVMAGMLGNILGYNSKPQTEGFQSALDSIAQRPDELKQRREFLKERLYRADDESKAAGQRLAFKNGMEKDAMDMATEQDRYKDTVGKARVGIAGNEINALKLGMERDQYDTGDTQANNLDRDMRRTQIEEIAKEKGARGERAKRLLETYNEQDGLGNVTPAARAKYLDLYLPQKDGTKWTFRNFDAGDESGVFAGNENTGEIKYGKMGTKTPKVGTGRTGKQIIDDELRKAYEKEYQGGVREPQNAVAQTRRMFEIAKTNPEAVGVLQYNIARSIAGEKGPLSNQDVQRAALASPQVVDSILQTLETRGFGALTDGQKVTLQKLLDASDEHFATKSSQIKKRYQIRAGEVGANERYIFGEDGPTDAPATAPEMKTSNTVRVSNGSETLEIDKSDLSDAEKDGYKVVK